MVWMAVVRSPHAHARIVSVDLAAAREAEGVVAAFSGADLADQWAGGLPCAWPVTEDIKLATHWPLAVDKARYAGDGVAVVIAESRALAKDAAELVQVEYEPLPAVSEVEAALADGAPILHDELGTNNCYTWKLEAGETERLFGEAAVTVKERYYQNRLIPNAIEPRGVIVQPVPTQGEYTMWSATQIPHILRTTLTLATGIPEAKLRVIAPDVGGGFGSKLNIYAEEALCLALARKLGVPIKWIEERSEAYVATIHGRDVVQVIELAATADGTITAVRVRLTAAMGAYLQLVTPGIPILGAWLYGGCYGVQGYDFECVGVYTNTTPTDAYRGAGRPEATYAIERAVDALARKLDMDPVELRRKNFIREFPATIAAGLTIDSGDYDASLDKALAMVDYEALRKEQAERRERNDTEAARDRLLDLRRDVRPRAVTDPRCDPVRRRWLGRVDDPLPADRHRAGDRRHLAARAGPRDDVLAAGRGPARSAGGERRGDPRRHDGLAARHGHLRQPQPHRRRCLALAGGRQDRREGEGDRGPPVRGRRGRSPGVRRARSRLPARTRR